MSGPAAQQPIDASTRYCAVYGYPVKHSASPAMHNAGIAELGLNWRYLACEVPPDELPQAIAGAKAMRFIGLNLTVPHKVLAVGLVDYLDASAQTWGTVNTVRFEGLDAAGQWCPLAIVPEAKHIRSAGFNTDAEAISRALQEDLQLTLRGARILLLGAGGAGRTAGLKLAAENAGALYLVNRTTDKAKALTDEIQQRYPGVKSIMGYPEDPIDLVLNATSLGLRKEDPLPYDETRFRLSQAKNVYDMIYRPAETPLLARARAAGCRTANGLAMLLHQGAKALEIWSGCPAPLETMRLALRKHVYG